MSSGDNDSDHGKKGNTHSSSRKRADKKRDDEKKNVDTDKVNSFY